MKRPAWWHPLLSRLTLKRGAPLRGRVHRVSIVAGGEVSIVLRFGLDEPRARELNQGALVEVVAVTPLEKAEGT